MNDNIKVPGGQSGSSSAVSLFGGDAYTGDFPVLKAFQEYIDAEQAKARKRMLGLSVFFIVLLVVVVITFVLALTFMIRQNQSLSDRLLDMAFKQPVQQFSNVQQPAPQVVQPVTMPAPQVTVVPQATQDSNLKPVLEKMERLTAALVEASKPKPPVQQVQRPVVTVQPQPAAPEPKEFVSEKAKILEQLRRQREELEKLREQAKAEKERLRKEEIERNRRKLYPEHYAREDARKEAQKRFESVKPVSYFGDADEEDDDLAEIARLAKEAREKEAARAEAERRAAAAAAKRKAEAEAEAKRRAAAEAEAKRKAAAEAEAKRKAAEAEAKRKAEEEAKRKAEAEARAKKEEAKKNEFTLEALLAPLGEEERSADSKKTGAASIGVTGRTKTEEFEINTKDDSSVPLLIPSMD